MSDRVPGRVQAIWLKRARRGPMDGVEEVRLEEGRGLVGNAERGGRRQITLIERERWESALEEVGADVDPSARRANVMLSGVDLKESRGRVLRLGPCRIEIRGETRPCHRMDEAHQGLQEALRPDWRGGAYGVVLDGGRLAVGHEAWWEGPA